MKIDRRTYADHYGPTAGDRIRLADTDLIIEIELALYEAVQPADVARTANRHDLDLAGVSGLEPHRGAGGNVQPHAVRRRAVERQPPVHFEEVKVRSDLNRPIAAVAHDEPSRRAAGVELDWLGSQQVFAGNHRIGWWTVTSFVPSGKVPST